MTKPFPRIVFMGTPEFAVPSLEALVEAGFPVVGVVTVPDKPAGRGQQLHASAVKQAALRLGIPVLQPEKLRSEEFLRDLKSLKPDLQIVVAFRMLPEVVWAAPPMGTFNLHASLLPQYRGAAPINWAIINGEKVTGLTTFFLRHEIDTGSILLQESVEIGNEESLGSLYERMMRAGARLVVRTVDGLIDQTIRPIPQENLLTPETTLHPAPKLNKENTRLDPFQAVRTQVNLVRGLSPYPAAHAAFCRAADDKILPVKVFRATADLSPVRGTPGKIEMQGKDRLLVECRDGWLELLELQPAGKGRMSAKEFLNGHRMEGDWILR